VIDDEDLLLGCRLKLQQAWRHRQALGEAIATEWEPGNPPPPHFGVILGDFLHNLRGVLDHVIWQLVVLNGHTPTRATSFPICDSRAEFDRRMKRSLRGLTAEQQALVEEFQPYRLDGDPRDHMLAVLRDLSNTDKHQFVHETDAVGDRSEPTLVFTRLAVTTEGLWRLETYVIYTVYERFARLFPLPSHAQPRSTATG